MVTILRWPVRPSSLCKHVDIAYTNRKCICFHREGNFCFPGESLCFHGEGVCFHGEGVCFHGEGVCFHRKGVCFQGECVCSQREGVCSQWEGVSFQGEGVCFQGEGTICFHAEKVSVSTGKAPVSTLLRSTYLVNMLSCLILYSSMSASDAICNHKSHQMHACNEELQTKDMTYWQHKSIFFTKCWYLN